CEGDLIQLVATGGTNTYSYNWTGNNLNGSTGSTVTATPDTTNTFLLIATDGVCVINDSLRIRVFPTPDAAYIFGEPEGCLGLDFQVQAADEPGVLYIWDFGDGTPVVNDILTVHTYDRAGLFTVNLTAIGERGCESINTDVQVEVRDTVSAAFTSSPLENELLYLPIAEISLTDESPNAVQWFWDFGDGNFSTDQNPSYTYTEAGVYDITLIATDDLGCVSRITKLPYEVREPLLFIPNVFSPNGDNVHDTYVIKYEGAEETLIKIFDRWGNLHFEASSFLDSWDGKSDGSDAPEGVYFYFIVVGDRSYEGELTLLR
ncbi:MAG: PKD domain-containing protein, partial [Bacteroidota bacterium]